MAAARRDKDRIERRALGATARAVAFDDFDIIEAQPAQSGAGEFDQLWLALHRDHGARDAADHRRGVAGARANLEHSIAGPNSGSLDHQGDDIGLRDRLLGFDRQGMVAISKVRMRRRHEFLARNGPEGVEDVRLANAAAAQLLLDHRLALAGEVCHGQHHGPTAGPNP